MVETHQPQPSGLRIGEKMIQGDRPIVEYRRRREELIEAARQEAQHVTQIIWWIRRDLRLTDNQALAAALAQGEQVIPVFVLDPALLDSPYAGEKRLAFLFGGLRQLDADLRARGSRLVVRRGEPLAELARCWPKPARPASLPRRISHPTPGSGMPASPTRCRCT